MGKDSSAQVFLVFLPVFGVHSGARETGKTEGGDSKPQNPEHRRGSVCTSSNGDTLKISTSSACVNSATHIPHLSASFQQMHTEKDNDTLPHLFAAFE